MTAPAWVDLPPGSAFDVENLPYGVFSTPGGEPRVGVRIGDHVLDAAAVLGDDTLARGSLNTFMARGPAAWSLARRRLAGLLTDPAHRAAVEPHLVPLADVRLHLPVEVADFVDFYSSIHHATNAGRLLRPGQEPLQPNWRHLPVGYHGRAGTVVVSGTPVVRPCGQRKAPGDPAPVFGPSTRLDIEAEVGFVVGVPSTLGEPVPTSAFQAWENVPLGPFLAKSFATSISPWVVPLAALEAARVPHPDQRPEPLPYLREDEPWGLDLHLEVALNGTVVSRPEFARMYWTAAQQLAHMTVNGASLRTGDLYGSGTVSGPDRREYGSLLELTENGARPLPRPGGGAAAYLLDGDTVRVAATAPGPDGAAIGLGEVTGTIEPARARPPAWREDAPA